MNLIAWPAHFPVWRRAMAVAVAVTAAIALGACATYSGSNLLPGSSTATEVEATMGAPAEKWTAADGSATWFYPRGPMGTTTYAVHIGALGRVMSVNQTLTYENIQQVRAGLGHWTAAEVRALLGPPNRVIRFDRQRLDAWEYHLTVVVNKLLTVQFSDDGVLRDVLLVDEAVSPARRRFPFW